MNLYITRPFHSPIYKIACDDNTLLNSLRILYGKYISDKLPKLAKPTESKLLDIYEIEIMPRDDGDYNFKHGGNCEIVSCPLFELKELCFRVTRFDESIIALHGAAVEYNGMAYVFLAATGNGKTTLTGYLTSSGFGYITDDCVLLDRVDFKVYPHNCPIHLREGGLEVLKQLGKAPNSIGESMERFVYTPDDTITEPLPLGGIFFIERSGSGNILLKPKSNDIVIELMKSPITNYEVTPYYHRTIMNLARKPCRKLMYKDMDFVAETIKQWTCFE